MATNRRRTGASVLRALGAVLIAVFTLVFGGFGAYLMRPEAARTVSSVRR